MSFNNLNIVRSKGVPVQPTSSLYKGDVTLPAYNKSHIWPPNINSHVGSGPTRWQKNPSVFQNIPIVIDADGLWHLTNNPGLIKGYRRAVLTPNALEFSRQVN
jgi:ATP-dependent NAD(P)H-hydrate dehydratase